MNEKKSYKPEWVPTNGGKEFAVNIKKGVAQTQNSKIKNISRYEPTIEEYVEGVLNNQKTLLSDGGISKSNIPAKLVYHLTEEDKLVLAWDISIQEISQQDWWSIRVDATTGNILNKNNWMVSCSFDHDHDAHEALDFNKNLYNIPNYTNTVESLGGCNTCYEVIAMPIESPYYGARSVETGIEDAIASPYGWHDTDGVSGAEFTVTKGNNVDAYEDGNNPGYQPDGGADLDFTGYPFDQIYSNANQYEDAAITNLFYWNNIIHDVMHTYGFDEAGGDFQENNYGNGGAGSDSVNAEAQDGSGTCNANFGTPPDGSNPTMQMYVCSDKDGDFDNLVIVHEYGHGISNRLTGGPGNTGCLNNSEQFGEVVFSVPFSFPILPVATANALRESIGVICQDKETGTALFYHKLKSIQDETHFFARSLQFLFATVHFVYHYSKKQNDIPSLILDI